MTQQLLDKITALHRKYAPNDEDLKVVLDHCKVVTEIALWCATNTKEAIDIELLETAALLHDIGSYPFLAAWEVRENYRSYYVQHAMLGAKIVEEEGFDKNIAEIIQTHVLMGLTKADILSTNMSLPLRDYEPTTVEGRILCYADRFHSKDPNFNSYEVFYDRLLESLPEQAKKFRASATEFGIPDLKALAKKYDHPIK